MKMFIDIIENLDEVTKIDPTYDSVELQQRLRRCLAH